MHDDGQGGDGRRGGPKPLSGLFTDVELRAYFASVVGQFRGPYGKRGGTGVLLAGQSKGLANNTTKDRVLSVTVTRSDLGGVLANVIFSQNQSGGASNNDFPVAFGVDSRERFVLNPGDQLSVQITSGGPATFVVGQETH